MEGVPAGEQLNSKSGRPSKADRIDQVARHHTSYASHINQHTGDDAMTKELTPNQLADVLESGKYAKTTGTLRDSKGYCCLGVYAEECGILQDDDGHGYVVVADFYRPKFEYDRLRELGPAWMRAAADDLYYADGLYYDKVEDQLINLNDDYPADQWRNVIDFLRNLA
jgi:hypothetical protein